MSISRPLGLRNFRYRAALISASAGPNGIEMHQHAKWLPAKAISSSSVGISARSCRARSPPFPDGFCQDYPARERLALFRALPILIGPLSQILQASLALARHRPEIVLYLSVSEIRTVAVPANGQAPIQGNASAFPICDLQACLPRRHPRLRRAILIRRLMLARWCRWAVLPSRSRARVPRSGDHL